MPDWLPVGLLVEVEVPVVVDAWAPEPESLSPELPAEADEEVLVEACAPEPVPDWLPLVDDAVGAEVEGVEQLAVLAWSLVALPDD